MQAIIPGIERPEIDASWLTLPSERSAAFLPTFTRISVALQSALREHVPAIYFKNPERFRDWKSAYPMLVYQASRPFRGRVRTELTYDVLNPRLMTVLFRRAKATLIPVLENVEAALRAEGLGEVADFYLPRHSLEILKTVQRLSASRRCLYRLVRNEAALVDALVNLSGVGKLSPKAQLKKLAAFRKKWQFQLRTLYPGGDFSPVSSELLEAAAQALRSFQDSRSKGDSEPGVT